MADNRDCLILQFSLILIPEMNRILKLENRALLTPYISFNSGWRRVKLNSGKTIYCYIGIHSKRIQRELNNTLKNMKAMIFRKLLPVAAFIVSTLSFAQIRTGVYFSSDKKYKEIIDEVGNPLSGNPVMIVQSFVPNHGSYIWFLNESKAGKSSYLAETPKDLHAGIFLEDHGGLLQQVTFKDFAQGLAQPRYLVNFCEVGDADKNGFPEFYLTYFEESDGLDAKPLKVIVYTDMGGKTLSKSKITGWIPFQEEDQYREVKDANFSLLPKEIRLKAEKILKEAGKEMN